MDPVLKEQIDNAVREALIAGVIYAGQEDDLRKLLYQRVTQSATDPTMRAWLAEKGITAIPTTTTPTWTAKSLISGQELGPSPYAPTTPTQPNAEEALISVAPGPRAGTEIWTYSSGKQLLMGITADVDQWGSPTGTQSLKVLDEVTPAKTAATAPGTSVRDYEYLIAKARAEDNETLAQQLTAEMYASYLPKAVGGATGAMTEYQAGSLALDRQRLAIQEQEAQRAWQETLTKAARTPEPLTYLSLLRGGAYPGQGGTDIYQGIKPVVPNILQAGGGGVAAQGGGWEAPTMPPGMATVAAGEPLAPATVPAGTLRAPGVQAQANESPFETAAYTEAVGYQNVPSMDWENLKRRIRSGMGPGLSPYSYGGIIPHK